MRLCLFWCEAVAQYTATTNSRDQTTTQRLQDIRAQMNQLRARLAIERDPKLVAELRADLDLAVRLAGAALAAEDLSRAVQSMGRSLEAELQTQTFIDDDVVYVIGGPLTSPTPHVYIDRDVYRLRAIELPSLEGVYRV